MKRFTLFLLLALPLVAADFDGSNDEIKYTGAAAADNNIWVSAWIERDSGGDSSSRIIADDDGGNEFQIYLSGNTLVGQVCGVSTGFYKRCDSSAISNNDPTHILVKIPISCDYTSQNYEFYIDGVQCSSFSGNVTNGTDFSGTGTIIIGARDSTSGYNFNGEIRHLAYWISGTDMTQNDATILANAKTNPMVAVFSMSVGPPDFYAPLIANNSEIAGGASGTDDGVNYDRGMTEVTR